MSKFIICFAGVFLLLLGPATAQEKPDRWYISPSAGYVMESDGMFYGNLTVGYNIVSPLRIDAFGGYWSSFGSSPAQVYTAALMVAAVPWYSLKEKGLLLESSIGVGFQHIQEESKTLFTCPVRMQITYYFTPAFGLGLEINSFISKKNYSRIQMGILVAFRF